MLDSQSQSRDVLKPKITEDAIYLDLYNAICERQLLPNTKLGEAVLAEHYGVSRTIIRQVLQRLAGDHLVKLEPHRGAFVASLTLQEARQIYEAWRLVETAIIRDVTKTITAEQIETLRTLIEAERKACDDNNYPLLTRLSVQFHIQLANLCSNPFLSRFLKELIPQTSLAYFYEIQNMPVCTKNEHGDILNLIAAGDADAAIASALKHLDGIEAALNAHASLDRQMSLIERLRIKTSSL